MSTLHQKAEHFRQLHLSGTCFVVANPWDAGSAKIFASLGFPALATTSAGCAFSLGRADGCGHLTPEQTLENARQIVDATDLPVSADIENGWSDEPTGVAAAIRRTASVGVVGASIEDSTSGPEGPIYDFDLAVDRVRAAAEAAASLEHPFMLTARSENFLHGRPDIGDTIRRLQAFQDAGADVLYAPGLRHLGDVKRIVESVDRPVNVLMGRAGFEGTLDDVQDLGVARVSVGSSLFRSAWWQMVQASREILDHGTFDFAYQTLAHSHLNAVFKGERPGPGSSD